MSQEVLVTGGFGYVGSCLTPHLLSLGHRVRVLDSNLYGDYGFAALEHLPAEMKSRLTFLRGDIRDQDLVSKGVKGVDAIVHLAAISNDPTGQVDEILTRQVNFDALGLVVGLAKAAGVKRFINASSSSVFGVKAEANVSESLEPEPLTYYSKYKMLSEWIVAGAASDKFCAVNIRPATICGVSPRQRFDLTVNKLTADAVRKRLITVHGGQQRRPNVGMSDIVNLYARLLETPVEKISGRTFNFGFENLKVIEIAELIQAELKDLDVAINVTETTDNRDYHISSDKILRELSYEPVSSIRAEVKKLRIALESGSYKNIDADEFYNMKTMKLNRDASAYKWLAR